MYYSVGHASTRYACACDTCSNARSTIISSVQRVTCLHAPPTYSSARLGNLMTSLDPRYSSNDIPDSIATQQQESFHPLSARDLWYLLKDKDPSLLSSPAALQILSMYPYWSFECCNLYEHIRSLMETDKNVGGCCDNKIQRSCSL